MSTPAVSEKDLAHLATLASLSVDPSQRERIVNDLSAILAHVAELGELDVENVPPTMTGGTVAPEWREDRIVPSPSNEEALAGAARKSDGGFSVPTFVEG